MVFKEYILDEFKIKNYKINPPSISSKYLEKCRTLLPELESIIKQYNLYIEDGYIDHELLQMSSNPIPYKDIKSKLEKKYIYPNYKSQAFNNIDYYFFLINVCFHIEKMQMISIILFMNYC